MCPRLSLQEAGQEQFQIPQIEPTPPAARATKASSPSCPRLSWVILSLSVGGEKKNTTNLANAKVISNNNNKDVFTRARPARSPKGRAERGGSEHVFREGLFGFTFPRGPPRQPGKGLQFERPNLPPSPLGSREGRPRRPPPACPAPDPHLARPGAAPRARASTASRERLGEAGGRAGAKTVRPRCRPARFLPRPQPRAARPEPPPPAAGAALPPAPAARRGAPPSASHLRGSRAPGLLAGGPRRSGVPPPPPAGPLPTSTRPGTRAP